MKRDPVLITTVSVIMIALSISLLNIYVFPDYLFDINVNKTVVDEENDLEWDIIDHASKVDLNSTLFATLNKTKILLNETTRMEALLNITIMINRARRHDTALYLKDNYKPKRINLHYTANLTYITDDSNYYTNVLNETFFNDAPTYYSYRINASNYQAKVNISAIGEQFTLNEVKNKLTEIFVNDTTRPSYVVQQTISYSENRGILNNYIIEFTRYVFYDSTGEVILFISNDGKISLPFDI